MIVLESLEIQSFSSTRWQARQDEMYQIHVAVETDLGMANDSMVVVDRTEVLNRTHGKGLLGTWSILVQSYRDCETCLW